MSKTVDPHQIERLEYGDYDENIRSRSLGYCIKKLYPKAFVSYQGCMFVVTGIEEADESRFRLPEDVFRRIVQKVKLSEHRFDVHFPESAPAVIVKVPSKIHARLYDKDDRNHFGLNWFFCHSCGRVLTRNRMHKAMLRCDDDSCNGSLDQAPIFIPRPLRESRTSRRRPIDPERHPLKCIRNVYWQVFCPHCDKQKAKSYRKLKMIDPTDPIGSLTWVCDKHGGTRVKDGLWCPPKGRYKPVYPSETLTRGLTVSDVRERGERQSIPRDVWSAFVPMASDISYFKDFDVYEITYGYVLASVIPAHFSTSLQNFVTFGRQFTTQGLAIRFGEEIFSVAKDIATKKYEGFEEERKKLQQLMNSTTKFERTVLHTVKHAFLAPLPQCTGLEPQKFFGSYDLETRTVYIYDSETGGLGGIKSIQEDEELFQRYLSLIRDNNIAGCPNECRFACRRCLFIENCGETNNALIRHLAGPIFGVETSMI